MKASKAGNSPFAIRHSRKQSNQKRKAKSEKQFLKFEFLTLFPEMIEPYFDLSILGRARKSKLIDVKVHQLRDWAVDKHGHVDDRPFGGGPGMVMRVEPFYAALKALHVQRITATAGSRHIHLNEGGTTYNVQRSTKYEVRGTRVILTSAKGKLFTQKDAQRLAKYDRVIFLCGRYEGVDERVADKLADEELSIGQYVMTGGELASMVMADAIARNIPGVLGKQESLEQESWNTDQTEYPQYTRPEEFNKWKVPKVLLSGDHKKIDEWRKDNR